MTEWLSPITLPSQALVLLLTRHKETGCLDVTGARLGKDETGADAWFTVDWSDAIMEHPPKYSDIIGWSYCPNLGDVTIMKQPK